MFDIPSFSTFGDAYPAVLAHVSRHGGQVSSRQGGGSRESRDVCFTLTDPRARIVYAPARRANIVFCYAEALWYLWGRDDLAMIGYYAPRLRDIPGDGVRLTGTAYGPKLFGAVTPGETSQWEQVRALLAADPATKRAVLTVFGPSELADLTNPDVSCTLGLQFLLRDGYLHAVTYMRANDAVIGLLCDVFSFTLIHEFAALQVGARLGTYSHHAGSMHINDTDAARAARVIADRHQYQEFPVTAMPPTGWDDLKIIEQHEAALRRDEEHLHPDDAARTGLDPYWQQVLLLFEVYRQITRNRGIPVSPATIEALNPGYRWLIAQRWPHSMPPGVPPPLARP